MLILDDLEKSLQTPKTKGFLQICSDCQIDLNQKLLVVVSKKNKLLKICDEKCEECRINLSFATKQFKFNKSSTVDFNKISNEKYRGDFLWIIILNQIVVIHKL